MPYSCGGAVCTIIPAWFLFARNYLASTGKISDILCWEVLLKFVKKIVIWFKSDKISFTVYEELITFMIISRCMLSEMKILYFKQYLSVDIVLCYTCLGHCAIQKLSSRECSFLLCIRHWTSWSVIIRAGVLLRRLPSCKYCRIESGVIFRCSSFNIRHTKKNVASKT
jgi:hypothetical protein